MRKQENRGVSVTRNRAIEYAKNKGYDAVAFLDADDYWLPNHIEALTKLSKRFPQAKVLASNYKYHEDNEKFTSTKFSGKLDTEQILDQYFRYTHLNSPLNSSNMMVKLSNSTITYNETLTHTEDTDYNIRAGIESTIAFSPEVTAIIDVQEKKRSSKVNVTKRKYLDLNKYEQFSSSHTGLKKFLDLNRFALTLEYKMGKQEKMAHSIIQEIDTTNLTLKQQLLLKMNGNQLLKLKDFQGFLNKSGLRWRTGT